MSKDIVYFSCLSMMLVAFAAGIFRWKQLSKPDQILTVLLAVTLGSEIIAWLFTVRYQNNMYVYHVYSPIELSFLALYYNEAIFFLKRRSIGWIVTATGAIFAVVNAVYFQPLHTFPSLFLLFEGFIVIMLSLFSFFSIFYKEEYKLVRNAQFWITFNLLIYWSFTFMIWGTYISFTQQFQGKLDIIFNMLSTINFLEYFNFALIFFFYHKMIRSGE